MRAQALLADPGFMAYVDRVEQAWVELEAEAAAELEAEAVQGSGGSGA